MDILIAARKSDLARLQAYQVGDRLAEINSDIKVQYHFRSSLGDINQDDPLWKMPEKGVFTEDFRDALIDGQFDMVVHSWKDLPIDQEPGSEIVATLPRADARDVLLLKKDHFNKIKGSGELNVFSSSPRRIYNLSAFFKDYFPANLKEVSFHNVRGNILTRVRKLLESNEVDGLVVAKAALDRLLSVQREEFEEGKAQLRQYLSQCLWQVLPLSLNPTAAAQGALAVEVSDKRADLKVLLKKIHCQTTWESVSRERQILKKHGGGCHQKIGVTHLVRDFGELTFLRGETEAGEVLREEEFTGFKGSLEKPFAGHNKWFERKDVEFEFPESCNAHFVARSQALPESVTIPTEQVLWTSGLKTWQSLAKRGLWVNGTAESLGETENKSIEILAQKKLQWAKWTHQTGYKSNEMIKVATYKLVESESPENIDTFKEFFWMSGSQFEIAIKKYPLLLKAKHFCGPGNTYTIISKILEHHGINQKPQRLPGYSTWLELIKDIKA